MSDHEFCSLGGSRTFIDSNLAQINTVLAGNVAKYLHAGMAEGVPLPALLDVVHEAVHHWCFNTPVGIGITLSRAQLVEAAFAGDSAATIDHYSRFTTVVGLLRPILEGLACFTEFDAYPGAENLRVPPLTWASLMAHPGALFTPMSAFDGDVESLIRDMLRSLRVTEFTARRKDSLITQPLEPVESGGYLLGYMLVRGLQAAVREKTSMASDGELWAAFVRAWFLYDYELVRLLSAEPDLAHPMAPASRIATRITTRLLDLANIDRTAKRVAAYNRSYAPGFQGDQQSSLDEALNSTPSIRASAIQSQQALGEALLTRSTDEHVTVVRNATLATIQNREWICLSSATGVIDSTLQSCQFTDDDGMPRLAGPTGFDRQGRDISYSGAGALELWLNTEHLHAVLVVASSRGVHMCLPLWGTAESAADFLSTATSNDSLIKLTGGLRAIVDNLLAQQQWWSGVNEILDAQVVGPELEAQADLAVAFYGATPEKAETLWESGFFEVFESVEALQAVVAYGLLDSVGSDLGDADRELLANLKFRIPLMAATAGASSGLRLANDDLTSVLI